MKNYELDIVFKDLVFDFVPMEEVNYDSAQNMISISADQEDDNRKTLIFHNVTKIIMESNEEYDMEIFCPGDSFLVTLYKVRGESVFLLPTEENIWTIHSSFPEIKDS
ncbi:hypothetical protein [Marinomonas sp.]|uniref:hypothetical protein n=1 Tax=Marinomonas sp. TaxID=1904862 RepID=UPI003BACEAB4